MRKIGEITTATTRYIIKVDENDNYNQYKVYQKWYDCGWHTKQVEKYGNLYSCLLYIEDQVRRGR